VSKIACLMILLSFGFASNSSAQTKNANLAVFPRGMQNAPPITLGELIYQSIPSDGRIDWDALQIPSVRWLTIGVGTTRWGDSFRYGLVRVRVGGRVTKVLRQRWEELSWSVTLDKGNEAARAEGVTSITIRPGLTPPGDGPELREMCFGQRFEGCDFPSSALRGPKHKLTLACSVGEESNGEDVFHATTADGRVGTVVWTKSTGSGGTSNDVRVLSDPATTYCRAAQSQW